MFEQTFKNIDDVLWKEAGCTTELDYTEQTSWMLFLKYLDDLEHKRAGDAALAGKIYSPIIERPYRWRIGPRQRGNDGSFDHDKALTGDDLVDFVNRKLSPTCTDSSNAPAGPTPSNTRSAKYSVRSKTSSRAATTCATRSNMDALRFRSQKEKHELSHLYEAKIRNMGNAGRNGGEYYTPRPLIRAMIQVVKPQDRRAHL